MPKLDTEIAQQKLGSCSGLWLGTEASLREYLADVSRFAGAGADPTTGIAFSGGAPVEEEEKLPYLVSVQSGVAVISLKGKFVSQDSWWNKYAGLISYQQIREAALYVLGRDDVTEVILDIASPGGSVAGVFDAVEALNALSSLKAVTAYSDSVAASAGYWLMSTASRRAASPVTLLGSIGVIQIVMEYVKMMEDDGVTTTVLRAGEFKGLGNPYEVLSNKAKTEIQGHIDHVNSVFIQSVSENLGVPYPDVEARMAQGREFVGSQAVEAGLIDAVSSFDKIYAGALVAAARPGDGKMPGKEISEGSLKAAAAAGTISAEELTQGLASLAAEVEVDPKVDTEIDADTKVDTKVEVDTEVEADPKVEGSATDKLIAQVVDLKVEVQGQALEITRLTEDVAPVAKILAEVTNNMAVALGRGQDEVSADSDLSVLVTSYQKVSADYAAAFKIGGVSVPTAGMAEEAEDSSEKVEVSGLEAAGVRAASAPQPEKVIPMAR